MPVLERVSGPSRVEGLEVATASGEGIAGITKPGARIELIDLSNAPKGRLHPDDVFVAGTADQRGAFTATLDTRVANAASGNLVRVRAAYADGTRSSWLDVRLAGTDTTNAFVAMFRLEPTFDAQSGMIQVVNNNGSRPLSEPFATLRFTNARTSASVTVELDQNGQLPNGKLLIAGAPGDVLKVAVSDGSNNVALGESCGELTVPVVESGTSERDIEDPALQKNDMTTDGVPKYAKKRFPVDWRLPDDFAKRIRQGNIGNCYFPAAIAALADANLETLRKLGKDNGDGTLTFRFFIKNQWKQITVDGDLYVRGSGDLLYGRDVQFALLEKAYALAKGSFETIGQGGNSGRVLGELLGKRYVFEFFDEMDQDKAWKLISRAVKTNTPACLGTHGTEEAARYSGTGVYANHAYSLFDCREEQKPDGTRERFVTLRNPWGESEPAGNGENDGVFELPLGKVMHLYETFESVA